MVKAIIFDFDGTIADSFEVFVNAIETVLKRRRPLSAKEISDLRKSSTREIIKRLGVKKRQLPLLAIKGRREISKHMDEVEVFDGIPRALKELSNAGYKLYIVSSNDDDNIATFLRKYKLDKYIARTWGSIGLFGKVKALKKVQKMEGLSAAECLYVGDETRDIEAAAKADVKCVAVAWGYSNPDTLKSYNPRAVAKNPDDLVKKLTLS